jgi:hypothetical protein
MSDGVSPTGAAQTADTDPASEAQQKNQETLLRQAFEQMLLVETFEMMSQAINK